MREAISRLLDEELSAEEEAALRAHLAECPDCRALFDAFSAVSGALRGELVEPPESLRENVMATLRRERILRRNRRIRRGLASVAAVAVLALGLRLAAPHTDAREDRSAAVLSAAPVGGAPLYEGSAEAEEDAPEEGAGLFAAAAVGAEAAKQRSAAAVPTSENAARYDAADAAALPARDALLAYLAGSAPEQTGEPGEAVATLRLADGTLTLYDCGGALCYRAEENGALLQTARSLAEIEAFLQAWQLQSP